MKKFSRENPFNREKDPVDSSPSFYQESLKEYFNSNRDYQIIASDIILDFMDELDTEHPFEALAGKIIKNLYNGSYAHKAEMIRPACRPAETGCRHPLLPLGMQTGLRRKYPSEGKNAENEYSYAHS